MKRRRPNQTASTTPTPPSKAARQALLGLSLLMGLFLGLLLAAFTDLSWLISQENSLIIIGILLAWGWFFASMIVIDWESWILGWQIEARKEKPEDQESASEIRCRYVWRVNGIGALLWIFFLVLEVSREGDPLPDLLIILASALGTSAPIALIAFYLSSAYRQQRENGGSKLLPPHVRANQLILIGAYALIWALCFLINNLPSNPIPRTASIAVCAIPFLFFIYLIFVNQKQLRAEGDQAQQNEQPTPGVDVPQKYTIGDDGEIVEVKPQRKRSKKSR